MSKLGSENSSKPKQVCLTIPMVGSKFKVADEANSITPHSKDMGLDGLLDDFLYGLFGASSSKAEPLGMAYQLCEPNLSTKRAFYVVDVYIDTPPDFDVEILHGLLSVENMKGCPFFNLKRFHVEAMSALSTLWQKWAIEVYGQSAVVKANLNWSDPVDFTAKFPHVLPQLFNEFPHLRCVVMPVWSKYQPAKLVWVAVTPKAALKKCVTKAEVRGFLEVKVDLTYA